MEALLNWYTFELQTDHKPLLWLRAKRTSKTKLGDGALCWKYLNFEIKHIGRKENVTPDSLSRSFQLDSVDMKIWEDELKHDAKIS